jgi:Protein of unknown function (DUF3293)
LLEAGTLAVRSAPGAEVGTWPWPTGDPVHVLTAWDPGPARPGPAINRARQAALEADLRPLAVEMVAAVGFDPVTGHREEGVAVLGVAEAMVLALGARYGQDAVFAWTPTTWSIVGCLDGRRRTSGWALSWSGPGPGPGAFLRIRLRHGGIDGAAATARRTTPIDREPGRMGP